MKNISLLSISLILTAAHIFSSCRSARPAAATGATATTGFLSPPLISNLYTADPSAHVFRGKIFIYPSHDIETGTKENAAGDHFDMRDYHVFSMKKINGKVKDHGVALSIADVPWAKRQLWAPAAAYKNGKYYLYFPAKDPQDVFRIGVATSDKPAGPFRAEAHPIPGSYSTDPAVYTDDDRRSYMYFGGISGGQLQKWQKGNFDSTYGQEPAANELALTPKVAQLADNMLQFDGPVKDIQILDENGKPLLAGDHKRRFFEASWMHKYNGKYYFSYSTGDTHFIAYATGAHPLGPFTYKGVILNPVKGWTNHHSIIEYKGRWYLFYHDTQLSGKTHLRNIKVTELNYRADGSIETITAQ